SDSRCQGRRAGTCRYRIPSSGSSRAACFWRLAWRRDKAWNLSHAESRTHFRIRSPSRSQTRFSHVRRRRHAAVERTRTVFSRSRAGSLQVSLRRTEDAGAHGTFVEEGESIEELMRNSPAEEGKADAREARAR